MFKASLSTSTTKRPTYYPNSTAFIHATASAAKEVVSYIKINLCSLCIEAFHFVSSMKCFLSVQVAQSAHPKTLPS
ncbi:hypothetical protein V6Z12_D10G117400 [Gossypium hirsutum]